MIAEGRPEHILQFKGHKQEIIALDIHPTCRYAVSTGQDSNFFVWDLKSQSAPRRYEGHKASLEDVKFSPAGALLASASSDGTIKLWEVENQKKEVTLTKAHMARIRGINFSCDGNLLCSCGDDKLMKVWSTVDRRNQGTYREHNNWVRYCEFSPTGKNIVSCDNRFVFVWDTETKKVIQRYKEHSGLIYQARFHSLGNILASASADGFIKLYDLRSRDVIQVYDHKSGVKTIDFHPHSAHLISSSEDGSTRIWNTQKSRLEWTIDVSSNRTKFSFEGDYFISGGSDKTLSVWKTGFFDSFKEKLPKNETIVSRGKKKVHYQVIESNSPKITEESQPRQSNMETTELKRQAQLFYNYEKQNFESGSNQRQKSAQKNTAIPQKILNKLNQISSQLDFITKTSQILEARVLNNQQQLQRLRSMVEINSEPESLQ